MRMIVGLDTPSDGRVTVAGRSYGRLRFPLREVGALAAEGRTRAGLKPSHARGGPDRRQPHHHRAGRLLAAGTVAEFIERREGHNVHAQSPDADVLVGLLRERGAVVTTDGPESLSITGMESRDVGIIAPHAGLTLYELTTEHASLEDAFMELTHEHGEFHAPEPTVQATPV